jgi:hypothetical protein
MALSGSVNTGTKSTGFKFNASGNGYTVDSDLGGISTGAGGDVTITAGQDIRSFLPVQSGVHSDGGSGAFGEQPGNVTLTAGHNVAGHYVVRNGIGQVTAANDAGENSRLLALSLVKGSWNVNAAHDILLQEVRNPNGIFNYLGYSTTLTKHRFDYDPDASVTLVAGNAVGLLGAILPRNNGEKISPLYPSRLTIEAKAGGITLGNDVTLFPSPNGSLMLQTTDGGSLVSSVAGVQHSILLSDSAAIRYKQSGDFGLYDHASVPVHSEAAQSVLVDISGNMKDTLIGAPTVALIKVGGDMLNSSFVGQNLRSSDVTVISVGGNIWNRNYYSFVSMGSQVAEPDLTLFDIAVPDPGSQLPAVSQVARKVFYNTVTRSLGYVGRMTPDEEKALLTMKVKTFNTDFGLMIPIVDPVTGDFITESKTFTDPATIHQLYLATQDVPNQRSLGYQINGPGKFKISAGNMDLGITDGVLSLGIAQNPALQPMTASGAGIEISLRGNLDMFSSTIGSQYGGAISINAAGSINVGSQDLLGSDEFPRGILTIRKADIDVVAGKNIEINGSRIATYDGGNISVISLEGNVNAGSGGSGYVKLNRPYVDPETGEVKSVSVTLPGSGIMAVNFPENVPGEAQVAVGNIRVETPRGDINASAGGIVQLSFNSIESKTASVTLNAGSKDADGKVLYDGSINAQGSGVIGGNVKLDATKDIKGTILARQDIGIVSKGDVSVTALAQGGVTVTAGGTVSGKVIGVGSVNVTGPTVEAALMSHNVTAAGNVTSSEVGFSQGNAAHATGQAASQSSQEEAAKTTQKNTDDEDEKKKYASARKAVLARYVGRVTVILPPQ